MALEWFHTSTCIVSAFSHSLVTRLNGKTTNPMGSVTFPRLCVVVCVFACVYGTHASIRGNATGRKAE